MAKDKRPLFFRRTLAGLTPCERGAEDALRSLGHGAVVRVEIRQARNVKHHNKYWKLLDVVCENMDSVKPETLHEVIKLRTGHVLVVKTAKGIIELPGSTAFSQMDQQEFAAFYEAAVRFILTDVLPGVNRAELDDAVMDMLATDRPMKEAS